MKVPIKYRRHGLHVWCNACKKTVTRNGCQHKKYQVYQSRIYNPLTKRQDCIRSYKTKSFKEAWTQHTAFRKELEDRNFQLLDFSEDIFQPTFLLDGARMYLDYLAGENVPSHERKVRSASHIRDVGQYMQRFINVMKDAYTKASQIPLSKIGKREVALYHDWLESQDYSDRYYNMHMKTMRQFFNYLIDYLGMEIENPFRNLVLRPENYVPVMITEDEFSKFLSVIKPENGYDYRGSKKTRMQHYRPWLRHAYMLALLTGERLNSLVLLKWKDVQGDLIRVPNHKVNQLKNTDKFASYTPITQDLREVLNSMVKGDSESYIIDPTSTGRNSLAKRLSKSFTHFWKLTGINKEVTFKNLRKSFITKVYEEAGEKALSFKHTQKETAIKHYVDAKRTVSEFTDRKMYSKLSEYITPLHNTGG